MEKRTENLVKKPLREFGKDDTLYVTILRSGYSFTYFCKFVELKRNLVTVEVISSDREWDTKYDGQQIRTIPSKCYLWGMSGNDKWPRCHWFKNTTDPVE